MNELPPCRRSVPATALTPQKWERKPLIGYEESQPFEFVNCGIGRLAQPERVLTAGKTALYQYDRSLLR